jgi:hypothetical protein
MNDLRVALMSQFGPDAHAEVSRLIAQTVTKVDTHHTESTDIKNPIDHSNSAEHTFVM